MRIVTVCLTVTGVFLGGSLLYAEDDLTASQVNDLRKSAEILSFSRPALSAGLVEIVKDEMGENGESEDKNKKDEMGEDAEDSRRIKILRDSAAEIKFGHEQLSASLSEMADQALKELGKDKED